MKRNPIKVVTAFLVTVATTVFGSLGASAIAAQNPVTPEATMEERLATIRQQLRQADGSPEINSEQLAEEQDDTLAYSWTSWYNWNNWTNSTY